ncbi:hypothetical protein VSDG_01440 [Cytospora chrysosperma]|uniref:Large ribosomal subunit protein bL33m n=1 Tax=Cytospora chrysosperma TaxID=252740 RepID=A0A423WJJ3_CYTCH|nr:hypothetical protein VSDG_01440 [Valsa sordida]
MAKKTKSRVVSVRLLSMALTGFFYQFTRPRTSPPMSMLKYDPIGTTKTLRRASDPVLPFGCHKAWRSKEEACSPSELPFFFSSRA